MTPQIWQAIAGVIAALAALAGALYGVITRPIQAQVDAIRGEMRAGFEFTRGEIHGMRDSTQAQLSDIIQRLGRIEGKLDDHEKRITTLEAQKWR